LKKDFLMNSTFFSLKERDDLRRQLSDVKKDFDKQTNILQKCLAVNKKLLVEKVCSFSIFTILNQKFIIRELY
jgi:hypothetical protein